jgi:hypothetical protein
MPDLHQLYRLRAFLVLSLLFLATLVQAASPASTTEAISAADECVIVFGGGGTITVNSRVNEVYFEVTASLADKIAQELSDLGYQVVVVTSRPSSTAAYLDPLLAAMSERPCSHVVDVTYFIDPIENDPERYGFNLRVYRLIPSGPPERPFSTVKVSSDMLKKQYRYTFDIWFHVPLFQLGRQMAFTTFDSKALSEVRRLGHP